MSGIAFTNMKSLTVVWMNGNFCINRDFNSSQIVDLGKEISDNCNRNRINHLMEKMIEENKDLWMKNARITSDNSATKARLESAADSKVELQKQISMLTSLYSKLEKSWEMTCEERNRELNVNLHGKLEEIEGLLDDQIKLREKVNESRSRNIYLEKKIEDLG